MTGKTLHVTNGDSVAGSLCEVGVAGELLPWRDVLHEGPVPCGLSAQALREVRARFIAEEGWGDFDSVLRDFCERDAALERWREFDEVVLWFEHDLYDQLQLAQLFDFFDRHDSGEGKLRLISVEDYLGQELFFGLGSLPSEELVPLYENRRKVTREQLALGRSAWRAFRDDDPTAILRWLGQYGSSPSPMPLLAPALVRHLEQFPWTVDGLGRTERQLLADVAAGLERPVDLFAHDHENEESPFLGDTTFWSYVKRLTSCRRPLLLSEATPEDRSWLVAPLRLTEDGELVLAGSRDQVELNGIDRWFGGVHLQGKATWRWDPEMRSLLHAFS